MIKARTTIIAALLLCLASGPVFGRNPTPDIFRILRPKTVFITSQSFDGNLGGLEGADQKCQDAANAAGLQGTFKAWLSAGNDPDQDSPGTRFTTLSVGPYILTNGGTVAGNWGDLTDGSISAPIRRDENGNIAGPGVWTATNFNGTPANEDCMDWTSTAQNVGGVGGDAGGTGASWTNGGIKTCDFEEHLYCFEQ